MILGVEFDKMQSEETFTGIDSYVVISQLFNHLSQHWLRVKPNKSR